MPYARAVIYCCGIGFSKKIDYWVGNRLPQVGSTTTIDISPGCCWEVETVNKVPANSQDNIDTYFFESEDDDLFECLCDNVDLANGWVQVEETKPVK